MKLELKHIAPYLPYGLEMAYRSHKTGIYEPRGKLVGVTNHSFETHPVRLLIEGMDFEHIWMFKPILRPMSDITKSFYEISYIDYLWFKVIGTDSDCFDLVEFYELCELGVIDRLPIIVFSQLLEWHFDVFGLIKQGLAVDVNSLKSEQ